MARKRIIYQSQSVLLKSQGSVTTIVKGVQNVSYGIDIAHEDVLQFGDLGAVDRVILEAPTANMEVNMYVGGISGVDLGIILDDTISGNPVGCSIGLDVTEGADYSVETETVNIESGMMTSLSAEASVGAIPTLTMGFEGIDLTYATTGITAPLTNIDVATQTGVIVGISNQTGDFSGNFVHPQSCNISFDLGAEGLQQLNLTTATPANPYVYARVPSYPGTATFELESFAVNKAVGVSLSSLASKASAGPKNEPFKGGKCNVNVVMGATKFSLVNATLDAVSFSNAIGDTAATCNCTFGTSIGGPDSSSRFVISAA